MQVPIAGLRAKNGTIGVWSSVDRRKVTTRTVSGARNSGGWVQVSRLANLLVNEVVIPTGLKDSWNGLQSSQVPQVLRPPDPGCGHQPAKLPLGDGVNADDRKLLDSFPYIADPQAGFDNTKGE